jgi:Cys-tRNA(Pro)/Cys-tRNA(Cys) deacylase
MGGKMKKTNAMRMIEQSKSPYEILTYEIDDDAVDGISVAHKVNRSVEVVFKTLVLQGASKQYYVCMIPVEEHLSLKKLAKVVMEKKIEMIPMKDILKVSGYIRGGCSPIGMKKNYPTVIHEDIEIIEDIVFSAGKIGMQIEMHTEDLLILLKAEIADICE